MKINIGYLLFKRALLEPEKEALVVGDVRRTYKELNLRSNRLAHAMKRLGISPGDRVAVLALNEPEYFELYFGLGKIGAIMVPINHRLAPAEVEDCLLNHPGIADVGVIGTSDEKWGEAVKAVVVIKKGEKVTQEEIIDWCKGRLARFKTPRQVAFAEEIPRTPTGKILKRVLRGIYN